MGEALNETELLLINTDILRLQIMGYLKNFLFIFEKREVHFY